MSIKEENLIDTTTWFSKLGGKILANENHRFFDTNQ
jgi:hypothetical protein